MMQSMDSSQYCTSVRHLCAEHARARALIVEKSGTFVLQLIKKIQISSFQFEIISSSFLLC